MMARLYYSVSVICLVHEIKRTGIKLCVVHEKSIVSVICLFHEIKRTGIKLCIVYEMKSISMNLSEEMLLT